MSRIRVGTRGSALALWQARAREGAPRRRLGHAVELRVITTTGDRLLDRRLDSVGGKGAFLKEIEEAMLAGEVDLAVHSLKDVPTVLPDGLSLVRGPRARRPARRSPLVGPTARRAAGGRHGGDDEPAAAGAAAARCARTSSSPTCAGTWTRASGGCERGASTRSCSRWRASRGSDGRRGHRGPRPAAVRARRRARGRSRSSAGTATAAVRDAVAPLDHAPTARAVTAERAFLAALGGGCNVPLGAHAFAAGDQLELVAFVAAADGSALLRGERRGSDPRGPRPRAGRRPALAGRLRPSRALRDGRARRPAPRRHAAQGPVLAARGAAAGARRLASSRSPRSRSWRPPDWAPLDEALTGLERYEWVVLDERERRRRGSRADRRPRPRAAPRRAGSSPGHPKVASVGPATTAALRSSFPEDRVALEPGVDFRAAALLEAFGRRGVQGARVLVPASTRAREELARGLRGLGARGGRRGRVRYRRAARARRGGPRVPERRLRSRPLRISLSGRGLCGRRQGSGRKGFRWRSSGRPPKPRPARPGWTSGGWLLPRRRRGSWPPPSGFWGLGASAFLTASH